MLDKRVIKKLKLKVNRYCIYSVCLISVIIFTSCKVPRQKPVVVNGVLDLSSWEFNRDELLRIQGNVNFYHRQLPYVNDNFYIDSLREKELIDFPKGLWYRNNLPAKGYGTFRFKVILPEETPDLMLKVLRVRSACEVWVNGDKIGSIGSVSKEEYLYTPSGNLLYANLKPNRQLDIVIPVANYHHTKGGGFAFGIFIGSRQKMVAERDWGLVYDALTTIFLLIISIYHIIVFLDNRHRYILLYFGVFCSTTAIRQLFVGDVIIYKVFPEIPFYIVQIFRYTPLYVGISFGILYYKKLLPQESLEWFVKMSIVFSALLFLYAIFSSTYQATYLPLFHIYFLWVVFVYIIYVSILATYRKRKFSKMILANTILAVFVFSNDLMHSENQIYTSFFSNFGLLFFLLILSIINHQKNKLAKNKVEELSFKVEELTEHVTSKDKEVSLLITESIKHLKAKQELTEKLERINKEHNIGNGLNTILAELKSEKLNDRRILLLKENIQEINQSFIVSLKDKHARLTKTDIEICALIRIGMSTAEIAKIRSTSIFSVKAFRYRLRKKFQVPKETSLTDYIRSL